MKKEIEDRLNDIKLEQFIWIIYLIIIFLNWIVNKYEINFLKTNNQKSKKIYRNLMTFIFIVLITIYLFYLKESWNSLKKLKKEDSKQKKQLTNINFLASTFVALSGILYLYIILKDENIEIEIAFN